MRLTDRDKYYNYLRMTPEMFDTLAGYVGPIIAKSKDFRDVTISAH